MIRNIFKILAIFIVGMVGGIFANQIFWPYFVERPLFYQYKLEQGPVYLTEVRETFIQENVALVEAAERAQKTVVRVSSKTKAGKIFQGSGLIVTSDGLMVTLAELAPQAADFSFFVADEPVSYQILKRDLNENLVLIKISNSNLNTASFARWEGLKMGERVFLVGANLVNEGIVKTFDQDIIQTSIIERGFLSGSPVFNIQGEVLGISIIDSQGNVSVIPISKIRAFVGI